jgi:Leucine-rich repeat (LRR) protein
LLDKIEEIIVVRYAMRLTTNIMLFIFLGCTSKHNSNVTELDLSNQNLSIFPDSIFSLTNLEYLQLGNSFTMYPPLSALGADKPSSENLNQIAKIPSDIENLQQLRVLGICFNNLQTLPKEIAKLKKLDTLDISFNENLNIARELETLKEMTWLKYLNILATNADTANIDKLRKALPKTKIVAKIEDLETKTLHTSN